MAVVTETTLRGRLAVRVAPELADSLLFAEVVATDVEGAKQVSRAAGSIQVSG